MNVSLIPKTILALVQPAVQATAARLFVLTTGRAGSANFQPTVTTFYETGLVTALYEQLLMSPVLAKYEIRHEMPYPGAAGRPKQVDLWLKPVGGGYPHLIEAGDFAPGKVHSDIRKISPINAHGGNWFLAFFRNPSHAADPWAEISRSLQRANGLDAVLVEVDRRLTTSFPVYRPNHPPDHFGAALIRARSVG